MKVVKITKVDRKKRIVAFECGHRRKEVNEKLPYALGQKVLCPQCPVLVP